MKGNRHKQRKSPGTVRIVAGNWRGSRLPVPDLPGLRPTGDRGREVLFNWLQPYIRGAVCADLFAGTGALGMEAASRGASKVFLVEKHAGAAKVLLQNAERLNAEQVEVIHGDAMAWLPAQSPASLDIVFVDPPFDAALHAPVMKLLGDSGVMKAGGLVYVESPRSEVFRADAAAWETIKEKAVGDVQMRLLKKI